MNSVFEFFRNHHVLAVVEDALENKAFTLNLSRFQLSDVPNLVKKCDNIMKLFLNHNQLTQLPDYLNTFRRLQILTLDYNKFWDPAGSRGRVKKQTYNLQHFPTVICNLTTLREINLSCNQIDELPPEIGRLNELQTFWCNNTGLTKIPDEIANCARLETFGARGNQIDTLPLTFGLLDRLKWLTLENNQLKSLPPSVIGLEKLVHLNLKSNYLTEVPGCLSCMKKLQFVFLNGNRIGTVGEEILQKTQFIKMINLNDNPIKEKIDLTKQSHVVVDRTVATSYNADVSPNDEEEIHNDSDLSDWENSIETSDIDTTDESTEENDIEDISVLIPELSRYITNFN